MRNHNRSDRQGGGESWIEGIPRVSKTFWTIDKPSSPPRAHPPHPMESNFSWHSPDKIELTYFLRFAALLMLYSLFTASPDTARELVKCSLNTILWKFFMVGNRWNYRDPLSLSLSLGHSHCVIKVNWNDFRIKILHVLSQSYTDSLSRWILCMCCTMSTTTTLCCLAENKLKIVQIFNQNSRQHYRTTSFHPFFPHRRRRTFRSRSKSLQ